MRNLIKHYKKTLILLSVFFCFIIFLFIYSFYPVFTYNKNIENIPGNIVLYDRNGKLITDKSKKNGYYKKMSTEGFSPLKNKFINSLIKIEDKNFYSNYGINILSKLRAIKDNLSGKKISGASTITEQFIKNKYFRRKKRSYLQKIRESILALYFTQKFSKDKILEKYLNNIYFGNNIYGIQGALELYFNKNKLEDLNEQEIVLLLSLLNYPSAEYSGEKSFNNYFNKIKNKLNFNFINKKIFLRKFRKKNIDTFPFVTNLYKNHFGEKTTIDSELQQYTKDLIERTLNHFKGKNVTNAAVYAIIPKTGEILIYQGSRDFKSNIIDGQVNIIEAKRQPGSTVKPFLYLQALEYGMNPDDLIIDIVNEYNSFVEGKIYITENYSLREYGLVRFKKALGNSMNNASVRLGSELGLENVYNFYKSYGFEFDYDVRHYGYSIVLGNAETTLKKLVNNYKKLLGNEENKFLLYDILSDPDNRDISFGVNSILNTSILQAVKTGTSSDFRDNWVISYHPDLVLGVWVGNNDNSSMIGVTGITGAGSIWHNIIEKAIELKYIKSTEDLIPLGIEQTEYCLDINCFEKELIYNKKGKKYSSRIREGLYSKKDLKEKLSEFEIDKLKKMGITLR